MNDLVIRGAEIVDGTGTAPFAGDVAVRNGRITAVGRNLGSSSRTINAEGLLLTPGWIDIHTHYDAQVTWDPQLAPSVWHGVTTALLGNCGVGFAPAAPEAREWLIGLMAGVEDIPVTSLVKGIPWGWESFPEYLDVLEKMPRTLDVGVLLSHGALRSYVMGERASTCHDANSKDLDRMGFLTREAVRAGAFGFSTSRTLGHIGIDGEPVPGTYASEEELTCIAHAINRAGGGLIQMILAGADGEDPASFSRDLDMMCRLATDTRCPITYLTGEVNMAPYRWRNELRRCEEVERRAGRIAPQVPGRPVCMLFSIQGDSPFHLLPSFAAVKELPLADKVAIMRKPDFRRSLLSEEDPNTTGLSIAYKDSMLWERTYRMGLPLSYTPGPENSVANIAKKQGCDPREVAYDLLLENDGRSFLMFACANYYHETLDSTHEMLCHPLTVLGAGDAGAHCRIICDASMPTYMLTQWARDWGHGHRLHLPLEFVIKRLASDGAKLFGLSDRGTIKPGLKADLNLIDFDNLSLGHPEIVHDLPGGMPRLMQKATGYVSTFVNGQAIQETGQDTGARPGKLIRSGPN